MTIVYPTLILLFFVLIVTKLARIANQQRAILAAQETIMAKLADVLQSVSDLSTAQQKSFDDITALIGTLGNLSPEDQATVDQIAAIVDRAKANEVAEQTAIEAHLPPPPPQV
jgi:hypothetical protein